MYCKKYEHALDNQALIKRVALIGSATFLSFLLFNTVFFNSAALAQRLTSRINETQDLGANSTSLPLGASQVSTKLGSSGDDLITGTESNDLILGLQGSDSIRGAGGADG